MDWDLVMVSNLFKMVGWMLCSIQALHYKKVGVKSLPKIGLYD